MANLITEAGADRVLACDLHSGQSMGYFDIPVDHVHGQVKKIFGLCLIFMYKLLAQIKDSVCLFQLNYICYKS